MKILVINGPNLNLSGYRDRKLYGGWTLVKINKKLENIASRSKTGLLFFQSNHEGALIDFLQKPQSRSSDGILINPGALVRYGWSLRQALKDLGKPVVEVHMTDIETTGINRSVNVLEDIRSAVVTGAKQRSYFEGLNILMTLLSL